jgi:hypothetical protein
MNTIDQRPLVDGKRLLEILFEEQSRPCLRWLREQQARRSIPFIKIGRFVFFDQDKVREALNLNHTVRSKGGSKQFHA